MLTLKRQSITGMVVFIMLWRCFSDFPGEEQRQLKLSDEIVCCSGSFIGRFNF